jgi:DNA-binding winged helix-turn-helix (wHTH) protein
MAGAAQCTVDPAQHAAYQVGGFTIDLGRKALLTAEGAELPLRPKSFSMLLLLVENAGRTLSNDAIMSSVWPGLFVTENNITQCVHEIRHALGDKAQQILRTRPRHGYLIAEDVVAIPMASGLEIGVAAPDRPIASLQSFQAGSPSNEGTGGHGVVQLKVPPRPAHERGFEYASGRVTSPDALLKPIGTYNLHCSVCDVDVPVGPLVDKIEANSSRPTTNAPNKDSQFDGLRRSPLLVEATGIGKPGAPGADNKDIDAVTIVSVDP